MRGLILTICIVFVPNVFSATQDQRGAVPIHPRHDDFKKVNDEMNNMFDNLQSKQHKVFTTTPALSDLQDGEFATFNSTANKIIWRSGNDIFAINGSCITVSR